MVRKYTLIFSIFGEKAKVLSTGKYRGTSEQKCYNHSIKHRNCSPNDHFFEEVHRSGGGEQLAKSSNEELHVIGTSHL